MVLEVHLEHAALDAHEERGRLVTTDACVPRWFFTSRIPPLERAVMGAIEREGLRRSMLLAPDALGATPPTDGALFHAAGVPIMQFLSAPCYLFDDQDTLDKVDRAHLVPITRAAARVIASTTGRSAAAMRTATVS